MELDNCQLIMITQVRSFIEKLKGDGKDYPQIKQACLDEYGESHWLVTSKRLREEALAAALFAYAMDDKQRESVLEIRNLTGQILL